MRWRWPKDAETVMWLVLVAMAFLIGARVLIECMRFLERLVFDAGKW